jgi:hypothetical protein
MVVSLNSGGNWSTQKKSIDLSIIQKCLVDIGTGITDIIGGPHDFLPPRSDRFDEFQKL